MRRTERALFKTKNAGHSQRPCPAFQLVKKQRFSAKLPKTGACGPVRHARRGVI